MYGSRKLAERSFSREAFSSLREGLNCGLGSREEVGDYGNNSRQSTRLEEVEDGGKRGKPGTSGSEPYQSCGEG